MMMFSKSDIFDAMLFSSIYEIWNLLTCLLGDLEHFKPSSFLHKHTKCFSVLWKLFLWSCSAKANNNRPWFLSYVCSGPIEAICMGAEKSPVGAVTPVNSSLTSNEQNLSVRPAAHLINNLKHRRPFMRCSTCTHTIYLWFHIWKEEKKLVWLQWEH